MSALGHSRPSSPRPKSMFVRCYSNSGQARRRLECPLSANSGHAEEHPPICQSNICDQNPGILPGIFILRQALVI
jgi:hypothetical protein